MKKQLDDLGPMQVLKRGYTMNTDREGQLISSASQLSPGDKIGIHFHDGRAVAETLSVTKEKTL